MALNSDSNGLLTIGNDDSRITRIGKFLRKHKIDELPQLINVLKGEMSIVGPRPEVRKYVNLYTDYQRQVLKVRPGMTDYASIRYCDENEILGTSDDPEQTYIHQIMLDKIELNKVYIDNPTISQYFYIIFLTLVRIFRK